MFFEISGIHVSPWIPPLVAFLISAITSTGGISGAFLLLPFQMSVLGYTSPSVSATNQLYNIVAIPGGVLRYIREGRMVWPLTWMVIAGTLPGVFAGALIRLSYLPDPANFKIFAGIMLLYLGYRLASDLLRSVKNKEHDNKSLKAQAASSDIKGLPKAITKEFNLNRLVFEFNNSTYSVSTIKIMLISMFVGVAGGIYGIGGGAIISPIYVAFFGLPIYTVAGPALAGTFFTSVAAVVFFQLLAPFYPDIGVAPDWLLGFLFGIGGFAGIYAGARMQKYLPSQIIKLILVSAILFIAINYLKDIIKLF